mmetsp:Transcript_42661/g.48159  ORF Transcript_42661/g.48159 Transcript_42661/m.48159 type:complete len:84 (+) Transcript_42661:155-406(+)
MMMNDYGMVSLCHNRCMVDGEELLESKSQDHYTVGGTGPEPSPFQYGNCALWKLKSNTDDDGNNSVSEIQRRGNAESNGTRIL